MQPTYMRSVSFWGKFTSGSRISASRSDLLKLPNISKTDPTTPLNAKNYSTAKAECMCEIVKKNTVEWNFPKLEISIVFNLSKIYSAIFFLIFPVSTSVCNEKIVIKTIWGHWLSF